MSGETVLVIGATGMLGEPVARRLASDGHQVKVMSRDVAKATKMFGIGFEIVAGDVDEEESLLIAMKNCTGVHTSLQGEAGDWALETRGAKAVCRVAAKIGTIRRLTIITGASTCEQNTWFPGTKAKFEAERAIIESGIPYTIFRCTMFMEMIPRFVKHGRAMIMGDQPNKWHWIAAGDYAAMVSNAFTTPESVNKILYVYGPEGLTFKEAMEIYVSICEPHARLSHTPFWVLTIISWFPGNKMLRKVGLPFMRYFSNVKELGDGKVANEILGAPKTTVREWCEAYLKTIKE